MFKRFMRLFDNRDWQKELSDLRQQNLSLSAHWDKVYEENKALKKKIHEFEREKSELSSRKDEILYNLRRCEQKSKRDKNIGNAFIGLGKGLKPSPVELSSKRGPGRPKKVKK